MAILREWRAEIRRDLRDEYVKSLETTALPGYRGTHGNLGAIVAVRDLDSERAEIITLSWWLDKQSIMAFAGEDIVRARYYPEDDKYLLTRPDTVQHYDSSVP